MQKAKTRIHIFSHLNHIALFSDNWRFDKKSEPSQKKYVKKKTKNVKKILVSRRQKKSETLNDCMKSGDMECPEQEKTCSFDIWGKFESKQDADRIQ